MLVYLYDESDDAFHRHRVDRVSQQVKDDLFNLDAVSGYPNRVLRKRPVQRKALLSDFSATKSGHILYRWRQVKRLFLGSPGLEQAAKVLNDVGRATNTGRSLIKPRFNFAWIVRSCAQPT